MIVNKTLNRNFEILGLLYMSNHQEYISKEYYIEAAKEHNINGEELYKKLGSVMKRYIQTFRKAMVSPEQPLFFFEDGFEGVNGEIVLLLQTMLGNHPHWVENIDAVQEDEIRLLLMRNVFEEYSFEKLPSFEEIIELLKATGLSSDLCWKFTLLLQTPKVYLSQMVSAIHKNIPAYEQALASIEKPLEKLLSNFWNFEYRIFPALENGAAVTPILIHPTGEIMDGEGNAYLGLYLRDVYKMLDKVKSTRNSLPSLLKALSDQSKFDILMLLKQSPRYNLELAEQLNLTAATVSHHMNVLLSHELVTVEKHDGRVYYSLQKETIENLIKELQTAFLF